MEGIKEALYCLFKDKSSKANIPVSQVEFINFLEAEAPDLILEKKVNFIDKITEQFIPLSAVIRIPAKKELKSVNNITLAILFLVEGKLHTDRSISFNYNTIANFLTLESLYTKEIQETKIFHKDFIKFGNPDGFWVVDGDGGYNLLNLIKSITIVSKLIEQALAGRLAVVNNMFTIGINTTRQISDHPLFYFEHPVYLEFNIFIDDYIDYRTGMVCDHYSTFSMIKDVVLEKFGTGNLNYVCSPTLRWRPTTELLAMYLQEILRVTIPEIITEITVTEINLPSTSRISSTVRFTGENQPNSMLNIAKRIGTMYEQ